MEDGLVRCRPIVATRAVSQVLILVVMEDGLVLSVLRRCSSKTSMSLNPCCNGRWSRTALRQVSMGAAAVS